MGERLSLNKNYIDIITIMKKLKNIYLPFVLLLTTVISYSQAEKKDCCENSVCGDKVKEYAVEITGLVSFLGNCSDTEANATTLERFRTQKPDTYNDLVRMVAILDEYLLSDNAKFEGTECLANALPTGNRSNVMCWINHIRFQVLKVKPVFPSTEFCGGWKKRIEINQGATAFLDKSNMAYLASARVYIIYTFYKKNECGGKFRIMAGPAFFLRNANGYATLSSRLAYRLTDLKANVFSLGNLNLFGGYNTNFDGFNYAEAGIEAELGPFGVNLAANANTDNGKWGFLLGVFFANKKKSNSKK